MGRLGGDLHDEVVEVERVVVQHNSAGISNNFKNETTDHANHESPGFVLDAEPELRNEKQAKSSSINGISSKRGLVVHLSTAEGACCHGAVDIALERANVCHLRCSFERFWGLNCRTRKKKRNWISVAMSLSMVDLMS